MFWVNSLEVLNNMLLFTHSQLNKYKQMIFFVKCPPKHFVLLGHYQWLVNNLSDVCDISVTFHIRESLNRQQLWTNRGHCGLSLTTHSSAAQPELSLWRSSTTALSSSFVGCYRRARSPGCENLNVCHRDDNVREDVQQYPSNTKTCRSTSAGGEHGENQGMLYVRWKVLFPMSGQK